MDRGAWQAVVRGIARVGHDLALYFLFLLFSYGCLSNFSKLFNYITFNFRGREREISLSLEFLCITQNKWAKASKECIRSLLPP